MVFSVHAGCDAADDSIVLHQLSHDPSGENPLGAMGDVNIWSGWFLVRHFKIGPLLSNPLRHFLRGAYRGG